MHDDQRLGDKSTYEEGALPRGDRIATVVGLPLAIAGASPSVARAFKWCGLKHLLEKKAA